MFKNRVIADLKNCNNLLNAEKVKRVEIEKKFMELQNIYDATDRNIMLVKGVMQCLPQKFITAGHCWYSINLYA